MQRELAEWVDSKLQHEEQPEGMDATAITEEDRKNTAKFQPPQWREIVAEEQNFQAECKHSRRVKMNQLMEVNLGIKNKPQMVKVSANLDSEFRAELVQFAAEV